MLKFTSLIFLAFFLLPSLQPTRAIQPSTSTSDQIPGWNLVFSDNFDTDVPMGGFSGCTPHVISQNPWRVDHSLSNCSGLPPGVKEKWWAYPDGWNDSKYGTYYPSKVMKIENGFLHQILHSEQISGNWLHLISTAVPKIPNSDGAYDGMLYGRYAIRYKIDNPVTGYKIAWLLWPESNNQPLDGEIDFPETKDFTDQSPACAYVHAIDGKPEGASYCTSQPPARGVWHTAIIEWTPSRLTFILDNQIIGNLIDKSKINHKPMSWRIQSQGMIHDAVEPANDTIVNIQIDWVKAWELLSGDFNGDGHVNLADYNLLLVGYGTTYNLSDYNQLLANYGK